MDYGSLLQKMADRNTLYTALVELTYSCNLDCFYCYNDRTLEAQPMSTGDYLHLFEDLAEMQVLNLVLTGGEPLAYPDFMLLGKKAHDLGFVIRIKTNGHALRGDLARRLKQEVDPAQLDISLHGADCRTHDRQTRVPGSFDRLMANLAELQALGFRLKLNCTLTRWNEHQPEAIFAIADELGVNIEFNPTVSPRDDGDREPLDISPSREGVRQLYETIWARRRRLADHRIARPEPDSGDPADSPPKGVQRVCTAGSTSVTIDPFGNVLPCVQWRRPTGNLHQSSIREIWEQASELQLVREITIGAVKTAEAISRDGSTAGFCPGLAEHATGSPLKSYPSIEMQMELRAITRDAHNDSAELGEERCPAE